MDLNEDKVIGEDLSNTNDVFFVQYYQDLESAYGSNEISRRYNSDRAHNAVVMCFMFDHSSQIDIYCGEMSVFRENFYAHINSDNELNSSDLGEKIKDEFCKRLKLFLDKENSHMNVIFENSISKPFDDLLCHEHFLSHKQKISFFYLPDSFKPKKILNHFTYSEDSNIYRLEDDKESHSAICSFNNIERINRLKQFYGVLKSYAKKIETNHIICS